MKTKINSIIAVTLIAIMVLGFTNKVNATTSILIQSDDKNSSSATLSESATIISNRLKDYSSEKFELVVIPEKSQIKLMFSDNWDVKVAEKLLTQKGEIGFYTTYNLTSLSQLSANSKHLLSLLKNDMASSSNDSRIGSCTTSDTAKINDYLQTFGKNQQCKFAWDHQPDSGKVSLYALRLEKGKGSLLAGTDIESMQSGKEKGMKINFIELTFKKSAIKLWADITLQNLSYPIAIVMDNTVLCAPVVNSVIENGKSQITGNFTEAETKLIVALGSNGELPISFHIVK